MKMSTSISQPIRLEHAVLPFLRTICTKRFMTMCGSVWVCHLGLSISLYTRGDYFCQKRARQTAPVLHVDNKRWIDISQRRSPIQVFSCKRRQWGKVDMSLGVWVRTRKSNPTVTGTPVLLKYMPKHTPHTAVSERACVCGTRVCAVREGKLAFTNLSQLWHGLCSSC